MTPLLDKDQLAARLRRSPRTIGRWWAAGLVLDPLPGPGHPTWDADEVAAWIKAGRPAAGEFTPAAFLPQSAARRRRPGTFARPGRLAWEVRSVPELFKPTFKDKRTGQARTTRWYYTRIQGRRVSLGTADKTVALRKAVELERQAEYGHDPGQLESARRRPLAEHLLDFEDALRAKGCWAGHVGILLGRLRKLFAEARLKTLADATAAAVESWLARQQREGRMAAQTRKHYAVHCLALGRWLVANGRAAKNPFAGLRTNLNDEADRRRRRALTAEECQRLLAAAAASKRTLGGMAGPHRRLFCMTALSTGLRRDELGSLVPESFRLDARPPTVTVEGQWTKNRKTATLPLRQDVAAELRDWLRDKPGGLTLLPV